MDPVKAFDIFTTWLYEITEPLEATDPDKINPEALDEVIRTLHTIRRHLVLADRPQEAEAIDLLRNTLIDLWERSTDLSWEKHH